jgi:hypothetical protein
MVYRIITIFLFNRVYMLFIGDIIIFFKNKYKNYKMNKNINNGPKSWKSSQEGHKTTSSMFI